MSPRYKFQYLSFPSKRPHSRVCPISNPRRSSIIKRYPEVHEHQDPWVLLLPSSNITKSGPGPTKIKLVSSALVANSKSGSHKIKIRAAKLEIDHHEILCLGSRRVTKRQRVLLIFYVAHRILCRIKRHVKLVDETMPWFGKQLQ